MAPIRIAHHLPFVSVDLRHKEQVLQLENVLVDTGSAATIFKTEDLANIGIELEPDDPIHYMVGVGGREIVIEKQIDSVAIGHLIAAPFTVQMGALDYGFSIDGIIGLDFLLHVRAIINLRDRVIDHS